MSDQFNYQIFSAITRGAPAVTDVDARSRLLESYAFHQPGSQALVCSAPSTESTSTVVMAVSSTELCGPRAAVLTPCAEFVQRMIDAKPARLSGAELTSLSWLPQSMLAGATCACCLPLDDKSGRTVAFLIATQGRDCAPGDSWWSLIELLAVAISATFVHEQTLAALQSERTLLRTVIDAIPTPVFVKDRAGTFRFANAALGELYDADPASLIGKTDRDYNQNAAEVDAFLADDLAVIESQQTLHIPEEQVTGADGRLRWLETHKRPLVEAGGTGDSVIGIANDITHLKLETALLGAQTKVLESLARGGALTAILEVLCVAWEAQLPGTMCSVLLLDGERGVLKSGAAPSLPPSYAEALNGMAIGEAAGSCGTAARTGPQVLVSEIRTDPRWAQFRELAESFQIRSCWSTPLIGASGIVLGTFAASLRVARAPTQRELQIIELGAHLASIAVDNRAEQEEKYRFESMSAQSKEMMAFVDKDFVYRAVNQSYLDAFGVRREDVIGRTLPEVLGDTYFQGLIKGLHERCHQGETVSRQLWTEQPLLGRRFVDVNYVPAKSDDGDILGVVVGIRDLSDHENALVRLRESETRFRDFAEIAADWFWETDAEHRFTYISERFQATTGVNSQDLLGRTTRDHLSDIGVDVERYSAHFDDLAAQRRFENFVFDAPSPDGRRIYSISGRPIVDDDGELLGYRGTGLDVTHEHQLNQKMVHLATHDSLTGLVNRHEFELRLKRVIQSLSEQGGQHALCYMDLDQFKLINDTCGHGAGDELLREIAGVMRERVRGRDTLARLGGDEFGIIMEHCKLPQAQRVAESLREAIADHRLYWDGHSFGVGVSIGVVAIESGSGGVEELLSNADSACYMAKESGRNRIHVYQSDDQEAAVRRGEMHSVSRLNEAVDAGRFELYRQSIQPIQHQEDAGQLFEVLVRMRADDGELVSPDRFLPAAERYHLAVKVDQWVVRNVLEWLADQRAVYDDLERIFINLSAQSLSDPRLLEFVIKEFERSAVPPGLVCFEVTETAATFNTSKAQQFMQSLKARGCLFALDDFGSGLSTFAFLKQLPVDYLKIDGLFVSDIVNDPVDRSIVRSVNDVGHVMGKRTIAEHVEDEQVLAILRDIGVDYGQGFLFDRPVPLSGSL